MSRAKRIVRGLERLAEDAEEMLPRLGRSARREVKSTPALEKAAPLAAKAEKPLAVRRAAPKALPAPPKPLALPKPGPGLPSFAVKPKGGQWWADAYIGGVRPSDLKLQVGRVPNSDKWYVRDGENGGIRAFATEDEARAMVRDVTDSYNKNASVERAVRRIADNRLRLDPNANGPLSQLQSWFLRAAPRYIKNEMGTPDDPMRALAERGNLHVALTPDEWSQAAGDVIKSDTIGDVLGLNDLYPKEGAMPGAGDDFRASVVTNMPWLTKAPVTDKVYRIGDTHTLEDKMGLSHLLDEMRNAMHERTDLPPDLAVRPESLGRMGLAQAAERVGLINQWRAKQAEQAQLSAMNSPAIHTFKEYAENNPMGLRWVELRAPDLDEGYTLDEATGEIMTPYGSNGPAGGAGDPRRPVLEEALRYEGDTMGHCVGGYCPDVMSGRSRIFSLRDAKGEPHVTIETSPAALTPDYVRSVAPDLAEAFKAQRGSGTSSIVDFVRANRPEIMKADDIIQIKGKQNRAPKDDYLPFVQDFVKSGQWGNIGDLNNTGLVKLPDGRYITQQQFDDVVRSEGLDDAYQSYDFNAHGFPRDPSYLGPEDWEQFSRHFEGYAIGGRVAADRCFCKHPMSVKRAA